MTEDTVERQGVRGGDEEVGRPGAGCGSGAFLPEAESVIRGEELEVVEDVVEGKLSPGDKLQMGVDRGPFDGVPPTGLAGHAALAVDQDDLPALGDDEVGRPAQRTGGVVQGEPYGLAHDSLSPGADVPAASVEFLGDALFMGVTDRLPSLKARHTGECDAHWAVRNSACLQAAHTSAAPPYRPCVSVAVHRCPAMSHPVSLNLTVTHSNLADSYCPVSSNRGLSH